MLLRRVGETNTFQLAGMFKLFHVSNVYCFKVYYINCDVGHYEDLLHIMEYCRVLFY